MRHSFGTGGSIISEFEDRQKESEVPSFEKILNQFTKEHFSSITDEQQENSNSFPKKNSLNLLLAHLLSNNKYETSYPVSEEEEKKAVEKINQLIDENKKEFLAILGLLKDRT